MVYKDYYHWLFYTNCNILYKYKKTYFSRIDIFKELESRDYALAFFNNNDEMNMFNIIGLRQLVLSIIGEYRDIELPVSWIGNKEFDVIKKLTTDGGSVIPLNLLREYDLANIDISFDFQHYYMFFNMNGSGCVHQREIGRVTLYYKDLTDFLLEYFLRNLCLEFGEKIISEAPIFISNNNAFGVKRLVLETYVQHSLIGNNEYKVINDAYCDLIRVSNIGISDSERERVERLEQYRTVFLENLKISLNRGFYMQCPMEIEIIRYEQLFKQLVDSFDQVERWYNNGRKGEVPFDIKSYYFNESKLSDHNRYKVQEEWINKEVQRRLIYNRELSSVVNDVHMDIKLGLIIFMFHLKLLGCERLYYKGSNVSLWMRKLTNEFFRRRTVLIKFIIKNSIDGLLHDMKEEGIIQMHQLENFFGYRMGEVIIDEVKEDFLNWFKLGYEQNSELQYKFIKKWAREFFVKFDNGKGLSLDEVFWSNRDKYNSVSDMLGNSNFYLSSKGTVGDCKVKVRGGKMRGISKNNYFNLYQDRNNIKIKGNLRNKVIIKREEFIKQRIVINSSMDTFIPLSKINRVISLLTSGSGVTYFSNSKKQKSEHYMRLINYLSYNKYVNREFLCLPLDYSSYDHTITLGFVRGVLEELSVYGLPELMTWYNQFKSVLDNEVVYFKEMGKDPENNQRYKYGMLSGWKITSSVESIGNAIITYGVFRELGIDLYDMETMGDDLIIVIKQYKLDREQQLKLLEKVCGFYEKLGFKMNVPKNSISYDFLEFLRVTFRPDLVQCYPTRILGSIAYLKPSKDEANFGAPELVGVINKICKRYGVISAGEVIAKYWCVNYKKEDIRKYMVGYYIRPWEYEIHRYKRVKYEYDIKDIKQTPIFRYYIGILGDGFSEIIEQYIERNLVKCEIEFTEIRPHRDKSRNGEWEIDRILHWMQDFKFYSSIEDEVGLFIPDFHLCEILKRICRERFFGDVEILRGFMMMINNRLLLMKVIRKEDWVQNKFIIPRVRTYSEMRVLLTMEKIKAAEYNIPAIVFSRYKEMFRKSLLYKIRYMIKEGREYQLMLSIARKNKDELLSRAVGIMLSGKCETMSPFSALPVAYMAD